MSLADYRSWILILALLLPAMPKIQVVNGVNVYPLELFLIVFFLPLAKKSWKFPICRTLFYLWGTVFIATLFSFSYVFDFGGVFRCIKGIVYVPLVYVVFFFCCKEKFSLSSFFKPYVLATITSSLLLFSWGLKFGQTNIWNVELIGSGLGNKVFSLQNMRIEQLPGMSHGIWGNYGCMIFTVAIVYLLKKKNLFWASISMLCFLYNIGMCVSREAVLTLSCVVGALCISTVQKKAYTITLKISVLKVITLFSLALFSVLFFYWDQLNIVSKFLYTIDALNTNGSEGNIELRINGWKCFFHSLKDYPQNILCGYGYNAEYYKDAIISAARHYTNLSKFATVPESYFIQFLAYGGIIAFLFSCLFWKKLFKLVSTIREYRAKRLFQGLFVGLFLANVFSGASIVSDVLYSQILLLIGFFYYNITHRYEFDEINNEMFK